MPPSVFQFAARFDDPTFAKPKSGRRVGPYIWAGHVFLLGALLAMALPGLGQALPAAEAAPISTGFSLPRTSGTLNYAVSGSESILWGYSGASGTASQTSLTGDLAYLSNSKRDPFSTVFSGGYSWGTSNIPSYAFLNLAMSQVLSAGRWNFVVSDSVSYLPGTPAAGLSGVAGVGDLGVNPIPVGSDTGQGVLTNYSTRVTNSATGSLARQLTGKTSINANGTYTILRFLNNPGNSNSSGLDNDSVTGGGGISHQLNARNSLGANYLYSKYSYSGDFSGVPAPGFVSQTASMQYMHQFTRRLNMTLNAGPQWSSENGSGTSPSLSFYISGTASYSGRFSRASVSYTRGTNSGYGVVGGSLGNSVSATGSRTFALVWTASSSLTYSHTTSLPSTVFAPYAFNTTIGSVQLSRAIVRSLSAYASYTAENQSNSSTGTAVDVFNGLTQVLGFGLTFSPSSIHLGRQ